MRAFFYQPNVLVIKAPDIEAVRSFFETFGLEFVEEQHGDGPKHYATVSKPGGCSVLEIYPSS